MVVGPGSRLKDSALPRALSPEPSIRTALRLPGRLELIGPPPLAYPGINLRQVVIDAAHRAADHRVEGRDALEAQPIRFDAAGEILPGARTAHHQAAHCSLPMSVVFIGSF